MGKTERSKWARAHESTWAANEFQLIFRFTLSCHAIASRLAVASCEGWLASAEALNERRIKREAKMAVSISALTERIVENIIASLTHYHRRPGRILRSGRFQRT